MPAEIPPSADAARLRRAALGRTILGCPAALHILHKAGASISPQELRCAPIVLSQLLDDACPPAGFPTPEGNANRWLLPEPWNGRLHTAPLLFIGQNPSASFFEAYPTLSEARTDAAVTRWLHYFESRFDGDAIKDGTRVKLRQPKDGDLYAKPNRFLSQVLKTAEALYGRPVAPGTDYALTEGVRCKSKDAIGVHLAVDQCAARYMKETILLSPARVIVCLGGIARRALLAGLCPTADWRSSKEDACKFNTVVPLSLLDPAMEEGRQVLFLRHPGAFGKSGVLDAKLINTLRLCLTGANQSV